MFIWNQPSHIFNFHFRRFLSLKKVGKKIYFSYIAEPYHYCVFNVSLIRWFNNYNSVKFWVYGNPAFFLPFWLYIDWKQSFFFFFNNDVTAPTLQLAPILIFNSIFRKWLHSNDAVFMLMGPHHNRTTRNCPLLPLTPLLLTPVPSRGICSKHLLNMRLESPTVQGHSQCKLRPEVFS